MKIIMSTVEPGKIETMKPTEEISIQRDAVSNSSASNTSIKTVMQWQVRRIGGSLAQVGG